MERKNPIAGIQAFSQLTKDDNYKKSIHLVVKISNAHADPYKFNLLKKGLLHIYNNEKQILFLVLVFS